MFRKSVFFLICLFAFPVYSSGSELKFATLEWEPYVYQHSNDGYVTQIVTMAFAESEYAINYSFFPWARVIYMAKMDAFAGYFPEYYSEDKKDDFYFSDPFPAAPLVFFKRKNDHIQYSNLQDLKEYSIAVVRGYVNTEEFDKASFLKKEETASDLQNLKKLIAGRVDLAVVDLYVGYYLLKKHLPDSMSLIDTVEPPLENKELYLCVSKDHPEAVKILQTFNEGLSRMKTDGSLGRLMDDFINRYSPSSKKGE